MWFDAMLVFGYAAILLYMGIRGGLKVHTAADFVAADGHYGTWVLFASLSASYIGGGYSAGNAAEAFSGGIRSTLALLGFSVSMLLVGKFLAPRVSAFAGECTVGGIIERSYGHTARIWSGFFSFFCCAGVVGAQMSGMGTVFHTLLGIPAWVGILLGSAIVLCYSTIGGLQSVIVADVLQFILLAVGMPLLLWRGLMSAGGLAPVLEAAPAAFWDPFGGGSPLAFVSLFCMMMLGEALAPPYTQRLLIGKSPRSTARATIYSGLFSVPFFVITGLIGLTAYALRVTVNASDAMPSLVMTVLPVGLRGIVMAAMVSMMLSAADSFLNSAAIGLVCDSLVPLFPHMRDKTQLRWLRFVNLAVGVAAIGVALVLPNLFDILMLAYTFWCPLLLCPLAAALCGLKARGRVFAAALLLGGAVTAIWNYALGKPFALDGALLGTAVNALVLLLGRTRGGAPAGKLSRRR